MNEFVDYLGEVFQQFGVVRARRMFGGYGVYLGAVMFGLVADDTLYLKADKQSANLFEEKGLARFEYVNSGKPVKMSYYHAPEEIYDDPDIAKKWAQYAYEAALRSRPPVSKSVKSKT